MAYKLQCHNFLSEFITRTRWWRRCVMKQLHHSQSANAKVSWVQLPGNKPVLCCGCPVELQLSLGLWCVQEDGTEGGEDLPGLGGGQLALGPHQAHAVSFPQGQDQAEGHRTSAGTAATTDSPVLARGALQPLDAAVGHGQDGLHSVTLPSGQQSWDQVSAIQRGSEDPCGDEKLEGMLSRDRCLTALVAAQFCSS